MKANNQSEAVQDAALQLTKKDQKKIRAAVKGQTQTICIGRSFNRAGAGSGTPIIIIDGGDGPKLQGQPYLKTNFCGKGGFRRTLYTSSTLRIEVGRDWVIANHD